MSAKTRHVASVATPLTATVSKESGPVATPETGDATTVPLVVNHEVSKFGGKAPATVPSAFATPVEGGLDFKNLHLQATTLIANKLGYTPGKSDPFLMFANKALYLGQSHEQVLQSLKTKIHSSPEFLKANTTSIVSGSRAQSFQKMCDGGATLPELKQSYPDFFPGWTDTQSGTYQAYAAGSASAQNQALQDTLLPTQLPSGETGYIPPGELFQTPEDFQAYQQGYNPDQSGSGNDQSFSGGNENPQQQQQNPEDNQQPQPAFINPDDESNLSQDDYFGLGKAEAQAENEAMLKAIGKGGSSTDPSGAGASKDPFGGLNTLSGALDGSLGTSDAFKAFLDAPAASSWDKENADVKKQLEDWDTAHPKSADGSSASSSADASSGAVLGPDAPIGATGVYEKVCQWAIDQANDPNVGYQNYAGRFGNMTDSNGKRYFDCSGLVNAAYEKFGISLGGGAKTTYSMKATWHQWADRVANDVGALRPGDIILMDEHVVMYIGGGKCVGAQGREGYYANRFQEQVNANIDVNDYLHKSDAIVLRPKVG